jgi:hypothetical protein
MTSHSVTFSRDNLIQLVLRPDFYEKNPALAPLEEEISACVKAFRESGQKAGCGCRADVSLIFDCLENLLTTLEGLRATDPEQLRDFVTYATPITPPENERIVLAVLFRTTGEQSDIHRYEFTCP